MAVELVRDAPVERRWLDDTSWVDVVPGWLRGADELYAHLAEPGRVDWQRGKVWRYERWVEEPRLSSWCAINRPLPHPALLDAHRRLQSQYRVQYDGFSLVWYRDGNDSVAFHRDRELRYLEETVIGVLTMGARRPWLLQPRTDRDRSRAPGRGEVIDLAPESGDLIVLGGRCQADWLHAVPKVPGAKAEVAGRMSVQWRWTSRRGRPEQGPNFYSPRNFSRR